MNKNLHTNFDEKNAFLTPIKKGKTVCSNTHARTPRLPASHDNETQQKCSHTRCIFVYQVSTASARYYGRVGSGVGTRELRVFTRGSEGTSSVAVVTFEKINISTARDITRGRGNDRKTHESSRGNTRWSFCVLFYALYDRSRRS